jgi:hypothetical protein
VHKRTTDKNQVSFEARFGFARDEGRVWQEVIPTAERCYSWSAGNTSNCVSRSNHDKFGIQVTFRSRDALAGSAMVQPSLIIAARDSLPEAALTAA